MERPVTQQGMMGMRTTTAGPGRQARRAGGREGRGAGPAGPRRRARRRRPLQDACGKGEGPVSFFSPPIPYPLALNLRARRTFPQVMDKSFYATQLRQKQGELTRVLAELQDELAALQRDAQAGFLFIYFASRQLRTLSCGSSNKRSLHPLPAGREF